MFFFSSGFAISTLDLFLIWAGGGWVLLQLTPIPPPASHCPALASGAFVLARGSVLCAHLPPSSPSFSASFTVWPQRANSRWGAMQSRKHQQRGDGGVFSHAYMIAHVLRRLCEIFVCGGKSAIFRCANIGFGTWLLFPVHASTYINFSSSLTVGHQSTDS